MSARSFLRCGATIPRAYGVYTCALAQGHSDPVHVHVCPEPACSRSAYTKWKILLSGERWSRPETPSGYGERHSKALSEFLARP